MACTMQAHGTRAANGSDGGSQRKPDGRIATSNKTMKTNSAHFPTSILIAALVAGSSSFATTQTVDTSTGTVLDSMTSRTGVAPANQGPTNLSASILPLDEEGETHGELTFIVVGNAVGVSGAINGLEPLQRYQAVVQAPLESPAVTATELAPPPSQAGIPNAGTPQSGTPSAPAPAAGQPDGQRRPGPPGSGEGTSTSSAQPPQTTNTTSDLSSPEMELGSMLADSNGTMSLNLTLNDKNLSPPPEGILGCTVVIKAMPSSGSTEKSSPVGSGIIVAPTPLVGDSGPGDGGK